jgi:hypothetical protein
VKPASFVLNVDAEGLVAALEFSQVLPPRGIYVLLNNRKIIRVGECSSGISRLKKGFRDPLRHTRRGKERKNYIAYSWRANYRGKPVHVDYFELKHLKYEDNHFRRALEAELTFQFRIAHKAWPVEMNEIHFMEVQRKDPLLVETATAILQHYGITYNASI